MFHFSSHLVGSFGRQPGPEALSGSSESRFININSGLVERGLWIIKDAPLTLIIQKITRVLEALSQELGTKMKYVSVTSQYYLSPLLFLLLAYLLPDVPQTRTRLMTFAFVVYSSWDAVLLNALMDHFSISFKFFLNCRSQEGLLDHPI